MGVVSPGFRREAVGEFVVLVGIHVLDVHVVHEHEAVAVALEEVDDIAAAEIEVNRVRRPVEALRVGEIEHELDFVLALDELAL